MKELFNDFGLELNDLNSMVKERAIEIANQLLEEEGWLKEEALKEGIKQAQEWFLDLEG
ncbi:hypothetical protein [Pedobacter cryophilus]|uniref:hypothetical protein n=1 Tax=Pedobacter cryophilus TaxID=2571271 RepID=UPI00145D9C46|nr:hypothetical protein [Pedobacter cryophilus]